MHETRFFRVTLADQTIIASLSQTRLFGEGVAEILQLQLTQLVQEQRPQRLVIDFAAVTTISSSVISRLILLQKKLDSVGTKMVLCNMSMPLQDVHRMLHLNGTVFDIRDSLEDALR